jgi:predicted GNAT superfamily acetyltransferase
MDGLLPKERSLVAADGIRIRPLSSVEDFRAAESLQRDIWSGSDIDVIPLHVLITAARNGGLVLGAFDGPALAGYVFGFLGLREAQGIPLRQRLKHCSHQLGVHPDYRGRGIGLLLKLAQREHVRELGLCLVTWTYSPMEARNAALNVCRLGGICRTYLPDLYGEMADDLNAGVLSDRFLVEWRIESAYVSERLERGAGAAERQQRLQQHLSSATILNPARGDFDPAPPERILAPEGSEVLVEIPADFREVRRRDAGLARAWQRQAREIFPRAFDRGYVVTDLLHGTSSGRPRTFYLLSTDFLDSENGGGEHDED